MKAIATSDGKFSMRGRKTGSGYRACKKDLMEMDRTRKTVHWHCDGSRSSENLKTEAATDATRRVASRLEAA